MRRVLILAALAALPIKASGHSSVSVVSNAHKGTFVALRTLALPLRVKGDSAPQRVSITTEDKLQLTGSFFAPKRPQSPAALLIHDAGADRAQLDAIAKRLNKQGFGVLTFDIRGHGDSKTASTDWSKLNDDERRGLWAQGVRDIKAAASWVLDQKQIHSTNLSILGYGAGCALAARHAKEDENVISLALLEPKPKDLGFDVKGDIEYLNGLPTFVVTPVDEAAETMVREANSLAGGRPYIELFHTQRKASTVLDDRKVPAKVSTWMRDMSKPRKR